MCPSFQLKIEKIKIKIIKGDRQIILTLTLATGTAKSRDTMLNLTSAMGFLLQVQDSCQGYHNLNTPPRDMTKKYQEQGHHFVTQGVTTEPVLNSHGPESHSFLSRQVRQGPEKGKSDSTLLMRGGVSVIYIGCSPWRLFIWSPMLLDTWHPGPKRRR